MKKRIIAVALLVIMTLSLVSYAEEQAAPQYEAEIAFLNSIGVLPANFSADAAVSRGMFAKMITDIIYDEIDAAESHKTNFTDIQYGSDYYNAVAILEGLNIVSGSGNSAFKPDDQIAFRDALVIMLKTMGYLYFAEAEGGYPTGYFSAAHKIGLTYGVTVTDKLDMKTAAKLVYNMLFVAAVEMEGITEGGISVTVNYLENFLSKHLNISKIEAQVVNDGVISFDNSGIDEEYIVLKELSTKEQLRIEKGSVVIPDIIGCYVNAFVKTDESTGRKELVHIAVDPDVTVTTVNSADIVNYSTTFVEYDVDYEETGKLKKINITDEVPAFFKNGIKLSQFNAEDLKPQYGNVKFIDNTGDKKADVVMITDVTGYIVASADAEAGSVISCSDNIGNTVDLSDPNKAYARVYKNGVLAKVTDIKENNIVSVAPAGQLKEGVQLYLLYVSDKTVNNVISSIDSGEKTLYVNEESYRLSALYSNSHSNVLELIISGNTYVLRLDYFGEVSYIDGIKSKNVNYAYLLNVVQTNAFSSIEVVAYTGYEAFSSFNVAPTVTIDGQSYKGITKAKLVELLSKRGEDGLPDEDNHLGTAIPPRPAIIKVNIKGEVYYIDTDIPTHGEEDLENSDAYVLRAGPRFFRDQGLYRDSNDGYMTTDGSFLLNKETKIMQVPVIDRYGFMGSEQIADDYYELPIDDIANYRMITVSDLNKSDRYDFQVYNVDPDSGIADLVVLRGYHDFDGSGDRDGSYGARYYNVFKRITKIYDEIEPDADFYKIYFTDYTGNDGEILVDRNTLHPYYKNIVFGEPYVHSNISESVEKLDTGDLFWYQAIGQKAVRLGRVLNFSEFNSFNTSTLPYDFGKLDGYEDNWGTNGVQVPFDVRLSYSLTGKNSSYFEIIVPLGMSGDVMKYARITDETGTTAKGGSFGQYYSGMEGIYVQQKYIPFARVTNIIVVEEKKCNSGTGKSCEIQVRQGSLGDIRYPSSNSIDGYKNASKILYYLPQQQNPTNIVIFNLDFENHDI